jgi:transcriptional regulator with XRE-family HTH domain
VIKNLRRSKGWSQAQLAEFSGLSIRTIQRIERGHKAGLESLKCLAAVFEVDLQSIQSSEGAEGDVQFLGANPILPVASVVETAEFYKESLGFDIDVLWRSPPYGVVARDQAIIEFGEGRKEVAGTGVCMIFLANVNVVYEEYSAKGLDIIGELANRDYGSRDFRVKDNNGNLLILSSPLINQRALLSAGTTKAINGN